MRRHHGPHCGCHQCKTIVYPTKHNCVNKYSESTVNHVHPSHTTIMDHHVVKNNHIFPHSTSVQNTWNSVDQYGGSFEVPPNPNQVAGASTPPPGAGMGPSEYGPGQVMGATQPGQGMHPGVHPDMHHGKQWKKPGKWC
jgi:spore coat protein D